MSNLAILLHGVGNRRIIWKWHISDKIKGFKKNPKLFAQKIWNCLETNFENLLWDKRHILKRGPTARSTQTRFSFQIPRVRERKWSDVPSLYTCRLVSIMTCWPGINCSICWSTCFNFPTSVNKVLNSYWVPLESLDAAIFLLLPTQACWIMKKKIKPQTWCKYSM